MPDQIITDKMLPVLLGHDYQHIMAKARVVQTAAEYRYDDGKPYISKPAKVEITIVCEDGHAQMLGDYVAAQEIVALSFSGVPIQNRIKETD